MSNKPGMKRKTSLSKLNPDPISKLEANLSDSPQSYEDEANSPSTSLGRGSKRPQHEVDGKVSEDLTLEVGKMIKEFSGNISNVLNAKKRRLEHLTKESTENATKKMLMTNKTQSLERKQLLDGFKEKLLASLQQQEKDLEKAKEVEDKFQKLMYQQQKSVQQVHIASSQHARNVQVLVQEFLKGMGEMEGQHVQAYSSVYQEVQKEMALLQKKILVDSQQQEMQNIKHILKNIT